MRHLRGLRVQGRFVPVAGIVEMVGALSGRYRLGIVTTRSRRDALAFLRQFGLEESFEVVAAREDTWRLKPHPEPVAYAAETMGLPPAECAMVGDTAVDMAAAKAAGSYAIGVLCGFGERQDLVTAGADLILEDTAALGNYL